MANISIIGSGYIGEIVGKGFLSVKHNVTFYDIVDRGLPNFTKDIALALKDSDVSFICVPTPTKNNVIDLCIIKEVTEKIGKVLSVSRGYHLLVVKSTVVPTTTQNIILPILKKYRKIGADLGICNNPEFLTQSSCTWTNDAQYIKTFFSEDRIIIGENDKKSGDILEELYKPLNKPVFRTDLTTSEMIKYASNCMLATKISYWNEIFLVCRALNLNSDTVASIVSMDTRIGKYGSIHGKAFGGACLPKDLKAFINFASKYHDVKLLKAVDEINGEMEKKYGKRG